MKNKPTESPFLEKVVNFDFDRFYTKKRRILLHVLAWLLYFLFLGFSYYGSPYLDLKSAALNSGRIMICNIFAFYLFFYVVVPYSFKLKNIWVFVICVILLIELWLIINHYYYYSLYTLEIQVKEGYFQSLVERNANTPFLEIISFESLLSHSIEVFMALSPILFGKLIFDLSRIYSNSVKINRKSEQLKHEGLLMENKFLQTQLSPHFFFNSLNNLYGLVLKKDKLAPDFVLKFSEIMRYTLYETSSNVVSLRDELDFIESYFEMEKMRYPKAYPIEKKIRIENISDLKIAPLLFFVFLENAFKYGLKSERPFLKLDLEVKDKMISFVVENDIFTLSKSKTAGGLGIKNARRRLELLYKDNHSLSIIKGEKSYIVHLSINLERNGKKNYMPDT